MTTTRKPPPHHLPKFFLILGGNSQHFFWHSFLLIDEEVTSCSSRNEGKGPPEPEFTGDLGGASTKSRPPPSPGAQQKVFKKGAGGLKLIQSLGCDYSHSPKRERPGNRPLPFM